MKKTPIRPSLSHAPGSRSEWSGDAGELQAALQKTLRGEVRFDAGSRALYATDASNYRQVPIGVVIPRDAEDVERTVEICRQFGAPILSRGGGTSLAGQCCNIAVVIDFSKYMSRILELDAENRRARVQPGVVLDHLRNAAERYHLTFGPDPATHNHNTLGGMIGNDSCGIHSIMAGRTMDNVEELDILTYDGLRLTVGATGLAQLGNLIATGGRVGEIYTRLKALGDNYSDLVRSRFPRIPRRVSGYNLDQLLPENGFHLARALVGSECTCVTILEATVRLVESPQGRVLLLLGYPDIFAAADHVPDMLRWEPIGLEAVDDKVTEFSRSMGLGVDGLDLLPEGRGWLLMEFGGTDRKEAAAKARRVIDNFQGKPPDVRLVEDPTEQEQVWRVRKAGLGATTFIPGTDKIAWPGWEDSAVHPGQLGDYLRDLRRLLDRYSYDGALYGHFGQGCVHTSTDFDLETREGIAAFRSFMEDATDLVVRYGGSLSGEHGDGQARGELLERMFGPELVEAFREFKAIWDPQGKMNPGKVVDSRPLDADLRQGEDYHPPTVETAFRYPDDFHKFSRATLRCVGIGECRKTDAGGTMCPSYMVTREEKHSTRGRARLLFEMLQGSPLTKGWRDEHVKEAMDLCLSCKGCKGECPVNVDMATYKAEFLSHYYEGRLRPLHAYAFGLLMYWARLASHIPWLANFLTRPPLISNIAGIVLGLTPHLRLPAFASYTFRERFKRRQAPAVTGRPPVVLWADTFNNHFQPGTAMAAVKVLEAAGYEVIVPEESLCCGRPLYDYGMLDRARQQLRHTMQVLRPYLAAGARVVCLEPSCASVFRDEAVNLFPDDPDAKRLAEQALLLSEFLEKHAQHFQLPVLHGKALLHGHCHHKALFKMTDEEAVLKRLGLDFQIVDSGCCGLAGAFGYEKDHYEVARAAGERVLLPAVREAPDDTLIIADGFSCREQITQHTGRQAFHLAEVLEMALRDK